MAKSPRVIPLLIAGVLVSATISVLLVKASAPEPSGLPAPLGIALIIVGAVLALLGLVTSRGWRLSGVLGGLSLACFGLFILTSGNLLAVTAGITLGLAAIITDAVALFKGRGTDLPPEGLGNGKLE